MYFVVFQSLSCVQLFAIPWPAAHQTSLSFTISWSLLKLMSVESVMPSNHLILCHILFLLPPIFPSVRVFSSESVQELQRDASPNCHFPSGHRLCRTAAPKSPGTPIGRTTPPRRSQEKPQNTASCRDHPIMRMPCASPSPGRRTAGLEKTSHCSPECQQAHHTFSPKSVLLGWMAVRAFVVVPKH